jgi:signal transduction histidine kinase
MRTRGSGIVWQRMSLTSTAHPRRMTVRRGDLLAAALIAVPVLASLIYRAIHDGQPVALLLIPAALAPILIRGRQPFAALALAVVVRSIYPQDDTLLLPVLAVLYTIATLRTWPILAGAGVAVTLAALIAEAGWGKSTAHGGVLGEVIFTFAACAAAIALGLYAGARRRLLDGLRERAERLDRERELLADRAVAEERLRIAQELHDAIAHNVSLMVVQAQGLGASLQDPRVLETTEAIAQLGRQAMTEMHRTLKLLRDDHTEAQLTPQPGLENLDNLLEQSRAAGLEIELTVEGQQRPLPQSVDLSAFRIVQEALTNVIKHAAGAHATVTVSYLPHELQLTIVDDGDNRAPTPPTHGHGVIGMRERTSLFGGTLTAEPRSDHGFQVTAVLPYPGGEA